MNPSHDAGGIGGEFELSSLLRTMGLVRLHHGRFSSAPCATACRILLLEPPFSAIRRACVRGSLALTRFASSLRQARFRCSACASNDAVDDAREIGPFHPRSRRQGLALEQAPVTWARISIVAAPASSPRTRYRR